MLPQYELIRMIFCRVIELTLRFLALASILMTFVVILVSQLPNAFALQQVAGQIDLDVSPGQISEFQWGLLSDSNRSTEIHLRAEGDGSQFLSLPTSVILEPGKYYWVNVVVSIPQNHPGGIQLKPSLFAKELGEGGGATVLNIQMQKVLTLTISPNPDSLFKTVLRDYPHTVTIGEEQVEIRVQSSADVDELSFDDGRKELSFRITEQAPSGTTAVHVGSLLKGPYTIRVDDMELTEHEFVSPEEGSIQVEHSRGTHYFSIIGTSVIPEFSLHILIVSSIFAIIIAGRVLNRSLSVVR